jgi:hypothetical protein
MPPEITLARKLGLAPHISPLQRKAAKLGLKDPEDWIALAVLRGCRHYNNHRHIQPVTEIQLSNEELSALLLSAANPYTPLLIRVGAQLLSDPKIKLETLVRLCQTENALLPLAWIANSGAETEPENSFWRELIRSIDRRAKTPPIFPTAVFPHPSRFRVETGFQRHGERKTIQKIWLRPTH